MFLFSTFEQMRLMILYIWRAWFYLLASIPVIFLFPFLAIAAIHPKGYNFIFWCARYIWSPFILFLSGFYTKVDYEEELPVGESFILVANHTSYIDPFVMFQVSKNPFVFVGKKELVKIPIFGYIYKRAAVMVDRSSKKSRWEVYGRVDKQLSLGYSICIFPEVKYTDDTIFLNEFKRGAFKISIDHHPSDDTFFNYRFLDISSPATGYMVWQYFKFIDFKLIFTPVFTGSYLNIDVFTS